MPPGEGTRAGGGADAPARPRRRARRLRGLPRTPDPRATTPRRARDWPRGGRVRRTTRRDARARPPRRIECQPMPHPGRRAGSRASRDESANKRASTRRARFDRALHTPRRARRLDLASMSALLAALERYARPDALTPPRPAPSPDASQPPPPTHPRRRSDLRRPSALFSQNLNRPPRRASPPRSFAARPPSLAHRRSSRVRLLAGAPAARASAPRPPPCGRRRVASAARTSRTTAWATARWRISCA